ncbi:hypothetical protein MKZ38_005396 [Zalerion maritima]|uniref:Peptidase M20 dimerisation domain-containing protein n=1 Tax=Zalerion maritima TaxID=339359 RepID=A0AAD5RK51_9PEZI|nr:hypothetical protein MKZ38_005396 [Zalerion maritima]
MLPSFFYPTISLLALPIVTARAQQHPINSQNAPSYRGSLVSLHRSLVEIESLTGNEYTVGNFLAEYLSNRGYQTQLNSLPPTDKTKPGETRSDLLAWRGSDFSHSKVVVTSHIDTVPPYIPYGISDEIPTSETVITGRGSVDAKASVAAQIIAVEELMAAGSLDTDDVALLYVVGEESTGDGMRAFSDMLGNMDPEPQIQAAIFGEPTENKLACGHKGHVGCVVTAKGKAGHSGYPWLGKSANEIMIKALAKLFGTDLGSSPLFGHTTVNVGIMDGGVASNVIPESALADLTIRVAIGPQESGADTVVERLRMVLKSIDSEAFDTQCFNGYGVIECECNVEGFETEIMNYGTDIPNFKANAKRYLYGPGTILVAHSDHEAIKLADLEESVEGYKKLVMHALETVATAGGGDADL